MISTAQRNRYLSNSVGTASPARLVTMLYDALVRDLLAAEAAIAARDYYVTNEKLCHAQEIVVELHSGLDPAAWEGGASLAALYTFLHTELVAANAAKEVARVVECRRLVEPLADAWRTAASAAAETAT
jgi:flagellar protein FliS